MPKNFDFVANAGQQVGAGVQNYLNEVGQANLQNHNYAQMQATREQAVKAYSDQYYQATGMDPNDPKSQVEALRIIGPYIPPPTPDMKSKDYYGLAMSNEATLMEKIKGAKNQRLDKEMADDKPAAGTSAPATAAPTTGSAPGAPQLSAQAGTAAPTTGSAPGTPQLSAQAGTAPTPQDSATIDQRSPAMQASGLQDMAAGYSPMSGSAIPKPVTGPTGNGKQVTTLPSGTTQDINSHQMNIPGQPQPDPTQMAGTAPAAPASEYDKFKKKLEGNHDLANYGPAKEKLANLEQKQIGSELPDLIKEGHTTQSELETALGKKYGIDILDKPGVKEMVKSLMSSKDFTELKQKGDLEKNKQALERLRLHFDQGKATKEHIGEALKIKHASIAGLSTAKANVKIIEGQINDIAKAGGISQKDKDGNDKLDHQGRKIPPVTDKSQVDAALSDLRNQLGAAHQQVDLYQTQYQEAAKYAADNGVKDSPQEMTYNPEDPMGTSGAQSGNRPSLDSFNR